MFSGATAVLARIIVIVPSAWITGQVYKSGSISITDLVSHSLSSYVTHAEWTASPDLLNLIFPRIMS